MTTQPTGLDFETTSLERGWPAGAARLSAAAALRPSPTLRDACLAHGAARENLDLLFSEALCVTTGQQPGLLTGPLYGVYKALSAIALALDASARLGRPVVPVFWVAGDDHDFAEGNHTYLLTGANSVERLTLRERDATAPSTPLYREAVGPEITEVFAAVRAALPATEFRDDVLAWLERSYKPQNNLAEAYALAMAELLGPYGLVVFRPTHPIAKQAMAQSLVQLLEQGRGLNEALATATADLERTGRPAPVTVDRDASLIMIEGAKGRDRLLLDGDAFVTRRSGERITLRELAEIARNEPQRLSPNVLARPVMEATLLPTIAYLAGPGELAYLPQAAPIYRVLGIEPQGVVPRWSGRAVEARVRKVLDKYRISADVLSQPAGALEASLVAEELPEDARVAIAQLRATLETQYARLETAAAGVDPTLRKPIDSTRNAALAGIGNVEKRIITHLKTQNDILGQQIEKARTNLFPLGQPQERVFNVASYLSRYGTGFLDTALAVCTKYVAALETAYLET